MPFLPPNQQRQSTEGNSIELPNLNLCCSVVFIFRARASALPYCPVDKFALFFYVWYCLFVANKFHLICLDLKSITSSTLVVDTPLEQLQPNPNTNSS